MKIKAGLERVLKINPQISERTWENFFKKYGRKLLALTKNYQHKYNN